MQVHVLDSGSALPATHGDDGLAAPDSSCAVEVEEAARCKLDVLLTLAMEVEGNFLSLQTERYALGSAAERCIVFDIWHHPL